MMIALVLDAMIPLNCPPPSIVTALVMVTVPNAPGSRASISPPVAVFEMAPANVLHGAVRLQGFASSPTPETQVRVAWACAPVVASSEIAITHRASLGCFIGILLRCIEMVGERGRLDFLCASMLLRSGRENMVHIAHVAGDSSDPRCASIHTANLLHILSNGTTVPDTAT